MSARPLGALIRESTAVAAAVHRRQAPIRRHVLGDSRTMPAEAYIYDKSTVSCVLRGDAEREGVHAQGYARTTACCCLVIGTVPISSGAAPVYTAGEDFMVAGGFEGQTSPDIDYP